jgi:putative flippase GtrA
MESAAHPMADTQSFISRAAGHPTVQQFLRFALVGVAGTIVHYSVMIALIELADMGVVLATSFGFLAGAAVSYVLNRRITFVSRQPMGVGFVKYVLALGVGLAINAGIVAGLQSLGAHYVIAQPIATGVVLFWNFGASRLLVFRD